MSIKKIFALVMTLALTLSLAACGGDGTPSSDTSADSSTSSTDTGSGTAEPAPAEKAVVAYTPLSMADVNVRTASDYLQNYMEENYGDEIEFIMTDPQLDLQNQVADMEQFIMQEVDLIILMPIDTVGLTASVEEANKAGIPVICYRSSIEGGEWTYCGSENYDAGVMQAEYAIENFPENAKVLYMSGTQGMSHTTDRYNGFWDLVGKERPDITMLAMQDGDYDKAKGMAIMEDWLQSFPEFDAVVCANDQMALGAMEVLKAANELEGVQILGIDAVDDAVAAIRDGGMAMTVFQDYLSQGSAVADMAYRAVVKGEAIEDEVIPFKPVTIDNVDTFKE